MMLHYLIVGLGGALGAMLRHGVGLYGLKNWGDGFPWGTFLINVTGSFVIGLFAGILAFSSQWSQEIRLFVIVGILGGFTTFSAFSLEAVLLLQKGQLLPALIYVSGSVILSILAASAGLYLMRVFST